MLDLYYSFSMVDFQGGSIENMNQERLEALSKNFVDSVAATFNTSCRAVSQQLLPHTNFSSCLLFFMKKKRNTKILIGKQCNTINQIRECIIWLQSKQRHYETY